MPFDPQKYMNKYNKEKEAQEKQDEAVLHTQLDEDKKASAQLEKIKQLLIDKMMGYKQHPYFFVDDCSAGIVKELYFYIDYEEEFSESGVESGKTFHTTEERGHFIKNHAHIMFSAENRGILRVWVSAYDENEGQEEYFPCAWDYSKMVDKYLELYFKRLFPL